MDRFKIYIMRRKCIAIRKRLYRVCLVCLDFDENKTEKCLEKVYSKFYEEINEENCDIKNIEAWLFKTSYLLAKEYK